MSVDPVAYSPRAEYRDPDCLGAVFVSDTTDFNIREAVRASSHRDGTFVVDDPLVIAALDRYDPLKRVAVPQEPARSSRSAPKSGATD